MILSDHIEINPGKRFGRPVIKGTRIAVGDVLNWLANGMSREDIKADFPELTDTHISACLHYAASREQQLRVAS